MSVRAFEALNGAEAFKQILRSRPIAKSSHFSVHGRACPEVKRHEAGFLVAKRFVKRAVSRNLIRRQMRQWLQMQCDSLLQSPGYTPMPVASQIVMRLTAPVPPQASGGPSRTHKAHKTVKTRKPSAASNALKRWVREELMGLNLVWPKSPRLQ